MERSLKKNNKKDKHEALPESRCIKANTVPDFKTLHKRNAEKMRKTKELAEKERATRPKSAAPSMFHSFNFQLNNLLELYSNERTKSSISVENDVHKQFKATKIRFVPDTPTPIKGQLFILVAYLKLL